MYIFPQDPWEMVYESLILNCAVPNNIIINTVDVKVSWYGLFVIVWACWCKFWVGRLVLFFRKRVDAVWLVCVLLSIYSLLDFDYLFL